MRVLHRLQISAVSLACAGLLIPSIVLEAAEASGPQIQQPTEELSVQDIALAPGGVFYGQVVEQSGKGKSGVQVIVRRDATQIADSVTDLDGRFAVSGLRGGLVQVTAGETSALYRLWAPNTAPPAARGRAMLVDQPTVRGQAPIVHMLSNPLVIVGLVAAAVAVPLAIHHFREHKSGS